MTSLHRRQALGLVGAGLVLGSGCTDLLGGTEPIETGDIPAYASVFPERDVPEYAFGAVDLETFQVVTAATDVDERHPPTDPMLVNGLGTVYLAYLYLQEAGRYGLGPVLEEQSESAGGEYLIFSAGAGAVYGSYDLAGIEHDLEALGYDEYRRESDLAVFGTDDASVSIGATTNAVVFAADAGADDPVSIVERAVETDAGEREPMHASNEGFEWLLRAGDTDRVTFCLYATDGELGVGDLDDRALDQDGEALDPDEDDGDDELAFDFDAFDGSAGVLQHLDVVSSDDRPTASVTLVYGDEDDIDEDALEVNLGTEADSMTIAQEDTTVKVDAEYGSEFGPE